MAAVTDGPPSLISPTDEPFLTLLENRLAQTAVERLGDAGADDSLRQVFVYGPAGARKTHLVRQLLWAERRRPDPAQVVRLTAAELAAELDEAYAGGRVPALRDRYASVGLFVCEDLAAIERKVETQRLLVSILDETLASGGRVLLTASKAPGEFEATLPRLVNRLHGGACVPIALPGQAGREQLLSAFARGRHLVIPADVLQILAAGLAVSPRELKAAVARLDELVHAEGAGLVNRSIAERFLADAVRPARPGLTEVAKAVAKEFGVTVASLRAPGRAAAAALPRQVAMALSRELTGLPLERVAAYYGRQNHGTVIHARKRLLARLDDDAALRRHVARIRRHLKAAV